MVRKRKAPRTGGKSPSLSGKVKPPRGGKSLWGRGRVSTRKPTGRGSGRTSKFRGKG